MILTNSRNETILLGERLGRSLNPNDVVAISGELGAGKTTMIQGIAKGLGVRNWVTSPTFTLINEFQGRISLFHMDMYRLNGPEDADDIAIEEYFNKGGVTVIEWAEKVRALLPDRVKEISIEIVSEDQRKVHLKGLSL